MKIYEDIYSNILSGDQLLLRIPVRAVLKFPPSGICSFARCRTSTRKRMRCNLLPPKIAYRHVIGQFAHRERHE